MSLEKVAINGSLFIPQSAAYKKAFVAKCVYHYSCMNETSPRKNVDYNF